MIDTNGDYRPFRIEYSSTVVEKYKALLEKAELQGREPAFIEATRRILRRIREAPDQFGEYMFSLTHTQQQFRIAVVEPIAVYFTIHLPSRFVFIQNVEFIG